MTVDPISEITADTIFCASIIIMSACNLYFGPRVASDRIAMQFDLRGNPTWFAPKGLALWGIVIFALAIRFLIWGLVNFAPDNVHGVNIGIAIASATNLVSYFIVLLVAMKTNPKRNVKIGL